MILPNFLGIGAQRAGTTWLHAMLSRHPDIFLPSSKELHFFDEKPEAADYQGVGKGRIWQRSYFDMKSRENWLWYGQQFEPGKECRAIGEITPYYSILSGRRINLIAKKLPNLKVIYIIRNPVQRALSGFRRQWSVHAHGKELDFDQIYHSIIYPAQLRHGEYRRNIKTWEKSFKNGKILYLFYDDLVQSPQNVLDQVFAFLGVESMQFTSTEMDRRINSSPELPIPEVIITTLNDYFTDQIAYIKKRFNRTLTK